MNIKKLNERLEKLLEDTEDNETLEKLKFVCNADYGEQVSGDCFELSPYDNYFIIDNRVSEEEYDKLIDILAKFYNGVIGKNFIFSIDYGGEEYREYEDYIDSDDCLLKYVFYITEKDKLTEKDYKEIENIVHKFNKETAFLT